MIRKDIERVCKDFKLIENYDKAIASSEVWICHHRLETHTASGERRTKDILKKELKEKGLVYHRPPEELIFLTEKDHNALHHGGKERHVSLETRKKISESLKGKDSINKNHTARQTYLSNKRYFDSLTYKKAAEELGVCITTIQKIRKESGYSFGSKTTWSLSEETKEKMSESRKGNTNVKGKHWHLENGKRVYTD